MNSTQKKRLLKLANFLQELKPQLFDLSTVTDFKDSYAISYPNKTDMKESFEGKCDTVACAMGWTPLLFGRMAEWTQGGVKSVKTGGGFHELANELFGLTHNQAEYLFMPNFYRQKRTAKTVAHRIRRFIETGLYRKFNENWELVWAK